MGKPSPDDSSVPKKNRYLQIVLLDNIQNVIVMKAMPTYFGLFIVFSYSILISSCKKEEIPTVNTLAASKIMISSARSGGNIISDGGDQVISSGIVWSKSGNPTLETHTGITADGVKLGIYESSMSDLEPNTNYIVRAYASNSKGTAYGNEVSFTTNPILLPNISTISVNSITTTSAIAEGNITADGGSSIISCGLCWSTTPNPTINNNKTSVDAKTGNFSSTLTGLHPGITYYLKAYASNAAGTAYGSELSFTTNKTTPTLTTSDLNSILYNSAVSGGNIISDGGESIISRGICWNKTSGPTISNEKTNDGSGLGIFNSSITGLEPNTTYYIRAYATNIIGTGYGNEISFTTINKTVTDADNNTYNTIIIGQQVWMKENLKVTHYSNGDPIPNITDNTAWSNLTTDAFCYQNNDPSNSVVYGTLYNFYAVIDSRKICPLGWHVPTDLEWKTLEIYLGMTSELANSTGARGSNEGGKLKEVGEIGWDTGSTYHWHFDVGSTNESGFTALPGGYRHFTGVFSGIYGYEGTWWSSSEYNADQAWKRELWYDSAKIIRNYESKKKGCSIRCLKD